MAEATSERGHPVFSERRNTLTLSQFISLYRGEMRRMSYSLHGFNQRTAFEFLNTRLREEPLQLYDDNFERLMTETELIPAQAAVTAVPEQLEQEARTAVAAILGDDNQVLHPAIPAIPYLPYVAPVAAQPARPAHRELLADPLTPFFVMLREEYRFQNPGQVRELKEFTRLPDETAVQMRSRMSKLLESLPGLLTDNQAAQQYLSQFPYSEKRRIQERLLLRLGTSEFTFQQAAAEAVREETEYTYLDSRDPSARKGKGDSTPLHDKVVDTGYSQQIAPRRNRQTASAARTKSVPAPTHHSVAAATTTTGPGAATVIRRCHRCGDPEHFANACPHKNLTCNHCQSKGLAGQGHTDNTCFGLHPELRPQQSTLRRQPVPVGFAAQPATVVTTAPPPDWEERLAAATTKAVTAALAKLQLTGSDYQFVGCAVPIAAATRPARTRQLPVRFRPPLPDAADHNRVRQPDLSRLPLGHEPLAPELQLGSEGSYNPDYTPAGDILTQLDMAHLAIERAKRRLTLLASRPPTPTTPGATPEDPSPPDPTPVDLTPPDDTSTSARTHPWTPASTPPTVPSSSTLGEVSTPATQLLQVAAANPLGQPLMRYAERMLVDPQVPYLDTSNHQITLNGHTPATVMVDTGAKPVLIGLQFALQIGVSGPSSSLLLTRLSQLQRQSSLCWV